MVNLVKSNNYTLEQYKEKEEKSPSTMLYFVFASIQKEKKPTIKIIKNLNILSATSGMTHYDGQIMMDKVIEPNKLYKLGPLNFICEDFSSEKSLKTMKQVSDADRYIVKEIESSVEVGEQSGNSTIEN
jgi:hypothetical protein